jgi:hypothetical protein
MERISWKFTRTQIDIYALYNFMVLHHLFHVLRDMISFDGCVHNYMITQMSYYD